MFTGIIQAVGTISSSKAVGGDRRISIHCPDLNLSSSSLGDSIAVNGVCLTAVEYLDQGFAADVSVETLNKTSLGNLKEGSPVNLEMALTPQTPLGGHLVSGHVDGLGKLLNSESDGRSWRYQFEVPGELQHYIAQKGSVTIDGTSLTVNEVSGNRFSVNIVPHTQEKTVFQYYRDGDAVNIEVDIIARYLERLINGRAQDSGGNQEMMDLLQRSGFLNTTSAGAE